MIKQVLITLVVSALTYSASAQFPPPRMNAGGDNYYEQRRQQNIENAANYGTNFIRFFPIRVMDVAGIGIGIDYEGLIDKDRKIGLVLPLSYTIDDQTFASPNGVIERANYFYASPGIKFYPFGQRKVTYAFGPNLLLGFGKGTNDGSYWDNGTSSWVTRTRNFTNTRISLLVNNYLNVQFADNFCFGVELGFGVRYVNIWKYDFGEDEKQGILPTGNFALSFGYRF